MLQVLVYTLMMMFCVSFGACLNVIVSGGSSLKLFCAVIMWLRGVGRGGGLRCGDSVDVGNRFRGDRACATDEDYNSDYNRVLPAGPVSNYGLR